MNKYRYWEILNELPEGWIIDKTAGSPAPNTVFVTNGKSLLSGNQKRALLKVEPPKDIIMPQNSIENKDHFREVTKMVDKSEPTIFPAKTVNCLARIKFKEQILKEIMFDLMVCEFENWDKKEYINEIKALINSIDTSCQNKVVNKKQPDLFSLLDAK